MFDKKFPQLPVENPLAKYSESMQDCFRALLASPDMESELDIATTEYANLLQYLNTPAQEPEKELRAKIHALLPHLKPVAHCFSIAERETRPLRMVLDAINESLPWAELEPRVLGSLQQLHRYYQTADRELKNGESESRKRWLTWKAQLSIPSVGHYLISVAGAHSLLCRDEFGKTIKKNKEGNHAVLFRDGLVFKPNPQPDEGADPIEPGMEHALVTWHQLLANSSESAASTEIIKLYQVPFNSIAAESNDGNYQPVSISGGVVQCGLMIQGMLLQDLLILQETMQHWVNCLGKSVVEKLLPQLLLALNPESNQDQTIIQYVDFLKQYFPEFETENKSDSTAQIEMVLNTFCNYNESCPKNMKLIGLEKLKKKSEIIHYIQRKNGLFNLYFAFVWCYKYPALMRGQTIESLISWANGFKRLYSLCPDIDAAAQIEISLNWTQRLNRDNITAMALTSFVTYTTDGKGDNYIVTFNFNELTGEPEDFKLFSIDSDRALLSNGVPLKGISFILKKNVPPAYWPDLNCVFLVLPGVLSTPISEVIVNTYLVKLH